MGGGILFFSFRDTICRFQDYDLTVFFTVHACILDGQLTYARMDVSPNSMR